MFCRLIRHSRTSCILVAIASTLATASAYALANNLDDLPLDKCTIDRVAAMLEYNAVQQNVDFAKQEGPLLGKIWLLTKKGTIPTKPLGEQLSRDDLRQFIEHSQHLKTIHAFELIESERQRDVEVISNLVRVADNDYRWHPSLDAKHPDMVFVFILFAMREAVPKEINITVPHLPQCSLEMAVHNVESEPINKLKKFNLVSTDQKLRELANKYNMKPIDRNRLADDDQKLYDDINHNELEPEGREIGFIYDLENIKLLERASLLIYANERKDITDSGGDIQQLGKTGQQMIADKQIDGLTIKAMNVWENVIRKQMPSEKMKELHTVGDMIKKDERPNSER